MRALLAALALFVFAVSAARAAAPLDGTQYAVIAPTFTGADGNTSYIRLLNKQGASAATSAKASTFAITVVGSPSAKIYGTAQMQVPALASPQYALSDILAAAGAGALTGGDTGYALYLQDADAAAFQHVIYNGANGFFEDVTACAASGYINGAGSDTLLLPNVHTSVLSAYPSQVFIHNVSNAATTYRITAIDAKTGAAIGNVSVDVAAHGSVTLAETVLEQQLNWKPAATQAHINLLFADTANPAAANAIVGQFITNQKLSAYVNMSAGCALSAAIPVPAAPAIVFKGALAASQVQPVGQGQSCSNCGGGIGDINATFTIVSRAGTVTGAYIPSNGPTASLGGTYDAASGALAMTSSDQFKFVFTGTVANGVLTGTMAGSNDQYGAYAGHDTTLTSAAAYCGSFQSNGQAKQLVLVTTPAGTVVGASSVGKGASLTGQMTGSSITAQSSQGGSLTATLQGDLINGTYTEGGAGVSFSAASCPISLPQAPTNGGFENVALYLTTQTPAGGSGSVTQTNSNPEGGLQLGTTETLTAVPGAGSTFKGWGGDCSGKNPVCTLKLMADRFVNATFCGTGNGNSVSCTGGGYSAPVTLKLAIDDGGVTGWHVYSTPSLVDCKAASCANSSISLPAGTQLTFTAQAPSPATFTGWGGACSGTGACVVTLNADTQLSVAFRPGSTPTCSVATPAAGSYTLGVAVTLSGGGGPGITSTPAGLIAGPSCNNPSAEFAAGTVVTLKANPTGGQFFKGWSGACSGTGDCTVTMDGDKQVTATYSTSNVSSCTTASNAAGTHSLHVGVNATGTGDWSVTSVPTGINAASPCNSVSWSFAAGTSVTLTATGSANQVFQSWGGTTCGTATTCTVKLDSDLNIGVSFVPKP